MSRKKCRGRTPTIGTLRDIGPLSPLVLGRPLSCPGWPDGGSAKQASGAGLHGRLGFHRRLTATDGSGYTFVVTPSRCAKIYSRSGQVISFLLNIMGSGSITDSNENFLSATSSSENND
jgi:hypothetical protein